MEEEVVDYLYKWALSDGFKKSKEDFVKLLQTNDEVLSYAFEFAQKDGFKKDKNALGALVGRTTTAAPVATVEPITTEPTKTELAKTEPTVTETVKTEPDNANTIDFRNQMDRDIKNILAGKDDFYGITMTKLSPDEEDIYQQWVKSLTPNLRDSAEDKNYDMRGAWKTGLQPELFYYDEQGNFQSAHPIDVKQQGSIYEPHLFSRDPNTGKMLKGPNHETFMYALEGDIKSGYYPYMDFKTGDIYTKKAEPQITVKEVEPEVKEEPKKEMPIGENLLPITEKTEVKAVETPSDKMVIKSEKKGKDKIAPEPMKIEPIKFETKEGQIQVEVPTFAIPEPKKKYKPYGEKGPDVYYSEEYDQYIIKEGDSKTIVNKGSGKYEEITNKISESVGSTKEGKGKCDTPPFVGCSKEQTALSDFKYYKGDDYAYGSGRTDEGGLIETLDYRKKFIEKNGESIWSLYGLVDDERKTEGDIYYANQEPPKSDRFITYKPFGNDKTLIYDKESGIILKQLDQKAPFVDLSSTHQVVDTQGNIVQEASDPRTYWQKYAKENPNEGLTVWQGFEIDHPEYKELKSIIEGIDYKKAKGSKNTFIPTFNPVPETPEWQKQ